MKPPLPLIAVVGPTASGKSQLALALAQALGGELISTDSMQVYRGMDLGTAKPSREERQLVPHYQIDVIEPDGVYSVGRYVQETEVLMAEIAARGKWPILVGGTGLYFRCTLYGICDVPPIPSEIKQQVALWQSEGSESLYHRLKQLDPLSAQPLHPHDTARVGRALEVFLTTGEPILNFQQAHPFTTPRYPVFSLGYTYERAALYARINQRTEAMFKAGWIEEVQGLLRRYAPDLRPFQAIGYRQIIEFLQGQKPQSALLPEIQQKTRNYAKRQETWFRKEPGIHWYAPGEETKIIQDVRDFLSSLTQ